jgi:DNA invertase Pin-like site-specific DNA recombinase
VPEDKVADVLRLRADGKTAEAIVKATGVGRTSVFRILKEAKSEAAG